MTPKDLGYSLLTDAQKERLRKATYADALVELNLILPSNIPAGPVLDMVMAGNPVLATPPGGATLPAADAAPGGSASPTPGADTRGEWTPPTAGAKAHPEGLSLDELRGKTPAVFKVVGRKRNEVTDHEITWFEVVSPGIVVQESLPSMLAGFRFARWLDMSTAEEPDLPGGDPLPGATEFKEWVPKNFAEMEKAWKRIGERPIFSWGSVEDELDREFHGEKNRAGASPLSTTGESMASGIPWNKSGTWWLKVKEVGPNGLGESTAWYEKVPVGTPGAVQFLGNILPNGGMEKHPGKIPAGNVLLIEVVSVNGGDAVLRFGADSNVMAGDRLAFDCKSHTFMMNCTSVDYMDRVHLIVVRPADAAGLQEKLEGCNRIVGISRPAQYGRQIVDGNRPWGEKKITDMYRSGRWPGLIDINPVWDATPEKPGEAAPHTTIGARIVKVLHAHKSNGYAMIVFDQPLAEGQHVSFQMAQMDFVMQVVDINPQHIEKEINGHVVMLAALNMSHAAQLSEYLAAASPDVAVFTLRPPSRPGTGRTAIVTLDNLYDPGSDKLIEAYQNKDLQVAVEDDPFYTTMSAAERADHIRSILTYRAKPIVDDEGKPLIEYGPPSLLHIRTIGNIHNGTVWIDFEPIQPSVGDKVEFTSSTDTSESVFSMRVIFRNLFWTHLVPMDDGDKERLEELMRTCDKKVVRYPRSVDRKPFTTEDFTRALAALRKQQKETNLLKEALNKPPVFRSSNNHPAIEFIRRGIVHLNQNLKSSGSTDVWEIDQTLTTYSVLCNRVVIYKTVNYRPQPGEHFDGWARILEGIIGMGLPAAKRQIDDLLSPSQQEVARKSIDSFDKELAALRKQQENEAMLDPGKKSIFGQTGMVLQIIEDEIEASLKGMVNPYVTLPPPDDYDPNKSLADNLAGAGVGDKKFYQFLQKKHPEYLQPLTDDGKPWPGPFVPPVRTSAPGGEPGPILLKPWEWLLCLLSAFWAGVGVVLLLNHLNLL